MKRILMEIGLSVVLVGCAASSENSTNFKNIESVSSTAKEGISSETEEMIEPLIIDDATVNLRSDMCTRTQYVQDNIESYDVYYQPEIPENPEAMCSVVLHRKAFDYSDIPMTSENAREEYIKYLPMMTTFLIDPLEEKYSNVNEEFFEKNGVPAYHFKPTYDSGLIVDIYSFITNKYDVITLLHVQNSKATSDYSEAFQWIIDHLEIKEFEMGNEIPNTTTTSSSNTHSSEEDTCTFKYADGSVCGRKTNKYEGLCDEHFEQLYETYQDAGGTKIPND